MGEGKCEELIMVELQSLAKMEDGSPLAGNFLGELLTKDNKAVTLTNGPRTLYGKLMELPKPLVLIEKTGESEPFHEDATRQSAILKAHGVVRRKAVFSGRPQLSV